MTIEVLVDLETEEKTAFHEKLLNDCLANIKRSRTQMSKHYRDWDRQEEIYRGEKYPDQEDVRQRAQGKPEKFIVANTHAQIQAFVSFLLGLFTQNATPFELKPKGNSNYGTRWEDSESVLERDCDKNHWNKVLYQFLLDTARFGIAPLEVSWTKETVKVFVVPEETTTQDTNGNTIKLPPAPGAWTEFTKFEGNRVRNISPYRWFPDVPSFPVAEFYRGRFCGHEEDYTMGDLYKLEDSGEVTGVKYIKALTRNITNRDGESRFSFGDFPASWSAEDFQAPVVVTKLRKWIVPADYKMDGDAVLGPETFPVLYNLWFANDNRMIRAEVSEEFHQEFGYGLGIYTPDMHRVVSLGLADIIYPLQDTISWYINSHITSVRRVVQNRMIVNPQFVEPKSYDGEGDILVKKGAGRIDPRMAVSQLQASDVTGGHMADANALGQLMQMITGVNDNLQGQPNAGRRSAQENRVQTAGAAGRLKMHAMILWEMGIGKIGRYMLSNSQQSLSFESFARIIGTDNPSQEELAQGITAQMKLAQRYMAFKSTPESIICGDDYLVFDSTLQSEKGFAAQSLQELLSMILTANPAAAQQLTSQINPTKLLEEIQWLRDGTDIERFTYTPQEQAQMQAQQQSAEQQQMALQQQQGQMEQAQGQQQLVQGQQQGQLDQAQAMQQMALEAQAHQQKLQQNQETHKQKLALAKSSSRQ